MDRAFRRRENDAKRSNDQALDAPSAGYENKLNIMYALVYLSLSSILCMRYLCRSSCCAITTAIYIVPRSPLAHDINPGSSTDIPYSSRESHALQSTSDSSAVTMIELQPGKAVPSYVRMSQHCSFRCGSIIRIGRFVHVNDTSQCLLTCLSGPRCSYVLCTYLSVMEATVLWGGLTSISNLSRLSNEKKMFLPATINLLLTANACHSSREGSLRIYCQSRW